METPLNIRQRNNAMIKFAFVCLAVVLLVIYHVMISMDLYDAGHSATNNAPSQEQAPVN